MITPLPGAAIAPTYSAHRGTPRILDISYHFLRFSNNAGGRLRSSVNGATVNTRELFELDFMSGLFPLKTNKLMMENASAELVEYVQRVLFAHPGDSSYRLLGQERAHAAKPNHHLRRTIVLDPVCTFFIYDLVYRNRRAFDSRVKPDRVSFGYRFIQGLPITVHKHSGITPRLSTLSVRISSTPSASIYPHISTRSITTI
jgi:hypothetical protein